MARPRLFLLGPGHYAYRVDIRFVNGAGNLLKTKTWELRKKADQPHQVVLLQANAKLVGKVPELKELGENYVALTVTVESLQGELSTSAFVGFQPDSVNQRVATFPLTLCVIVAPEGLNFSCYTATPKSHG
jgi:hypothetical protein